LTTPLARLLSRLTFFFAFVLVCAGYGTATLAAGQACPPDFGSGRLCTAKDFEVTGVLTSGPDNCTEGDTISIELLVGLRATANERYDVGLYAGDNGGEVIGGASCSFTSLTPQTTSNALFNGTSPAGAGPYRALDGDACGDVRSSDGVNYRRFVLTQVLCRDRDGDGDVDINGLVVWSQNASQDVCTDPNDAAQFFPEQSSKCQLAPDFNLPIIVEPAPTMKVVKTALPRELLEPGGVVRFRVLVFNSSAKTDPLQLTSLSDDIHGNLNGRGTCSVPSIIAPGTFYECSFSAPVSGTAGYSETDTVTAQALDDDGEMLAASDDATVMIVAGPTQPSIAVTKVVFPARVPEPGSSVVYGLRVTNTSDTESVVLDSLSDNLYGDLSSAGTCGALLGVGLAPGETVSCVFTEQVPLPADFPGQPGDTVTDTVTAMGLADSAQPVMSMDDATVTILDVPSFLRARKIAVPSALAEPGGDFEFRLTVQNASPVDTVTINSLVDDVYGNFNGQGSCRVPQVLAPTEVYNCSFKGSFFGAAGAYQVDTIRVSGRDDDGASVTAFARAQVILTGGGVVPPVTLGVTKIANPTSVVEPGGDVTFTVTVTNTSAVGSVTLDSLQDAPYGNLDGRGSCATGAVLAPGDTYTCSFTAPVQGAAGDEVVDTVTATGTGPAGAQPTAEDSASVAIIGAGSPALQVSKSASPRLLSAPGGNVTFTVTVANTGAETLQLTALTDSVFGNLVGQGSCVTGATLGPGESYNCNFDAPVTGQSPLVHLDTVSAAAVPVGGGALYASARALVLILGGGSLPNKVPLPAWLLLALGVALAALAVRALR